MLNFQEAEIGTYRNWSNMADKNNIKEKLVAKQIGEDKMLVSTIVDGVTVYIRQPIEAIQTDKLTRKANIISANTTKLIAIKAKKSMTNKTDKIQALLTSAKKEVKP